MKIKRQKRVKKILNFYKNNFAVREPFQILLDGNFCHAALEKKVDVREQLTNYLNGEVKILTTVCAVKEVEKLVVTVPNLYGAMLILKQFPVHKCGHEKAPVGVTSCFLSMVGESNSSHYLVATQDTNLRSQLRRIPGTPIIYLFYNAPLLEQPSGESEFSAEEKNNARFLPTEFEKRRLEALKKELHLDEGQEMQRKRKRKGGPNPLSCLKKKVKPPAPKPEPNPNKKKRKPRIRIRVPKHIREILASREQAKEKAAQTAA